MGGPPNSGSGRPLVLHVGHYAGNFISIISNPTKLYKVVSFSCLREVQ